MCVGILVGHSALYQQAQMVRGFLALLRRHGPAEPFFGAVVPCADGVIANFIGRPLSDLPLPAIALDTPFLFEIDPAARIARRITSACPATAGLVPAGRSMVGYSPAPRSLSILLRLFS